jgi:hypothetical protein
MQKQNGPALFGAGTFGIFSLLLLFTMSLKIYNLFEYAINTQMLNPESRIAVMTEDPNA